MKNFIFELERETLHIYLGILIMLLVIFCNQTIWILFFALIIGIILSFLSLKFKLPFLNYMLQKFERPKYLHKFPGKGVLFFIAGCLIVIKLFGSKIALASIVILTFGDSISHLVGLFKKERGKIKNIKYNIEEGLKDIRGTIVGAVIAGIIASFFVKPLYAFIASFIAMGAEFISLKLGEDNVDDNIIIPLVAGTILYLLITFF